jgi:hypothetical protein
MVEVLELVGWVVVGILVVEEMDGLDKLDEVLVGRRLDAEGVVELLEEVLVRMDVERVVELPDEVLVRMDVERVVELLDEVLGRLGFELGAGLDVEGSVELLDEVLGRLELEEDGGALVPTELLDEVLEGGWEETEVDDEYPEITLDAIMLDEEEELLRTELLELDPATAVRLYIVNRDEPPNCLNY